VLALPCPAYTCMAHAGGIEYTGLGLLLAYPVLLLYAHV